MARRARIPACNAMGHGMHRLAISLAAGLAYNPAIASAEQRIFPSLPSGQVEFTMPSASIGCSYTQKGGTPLYQPADGGQVLSCDRIEPD
jgi:hypothetical protein